MDTSFSCCLRLHLTLIHYYYCKLHLFCSQLQWLLHKLVGARRCYFIYQQCNPLRECFFSVTLIKVAGKWALFHMDYLYVAPKFTTTKFYTRNSHSCDKTCFLTLHTHYAQCRWTAWRKRGILIEVKFFTSEFIKWRDIKLLWN